MSSNLQKWGVSDKFSSKVVNLSHIPSANRTMTLSILMMDHDQPKVFASPKSALRLRLKVAKPIVCQLSGMNGSENLNPKRWHTLLSQNVLVSKRRHSFARIHERTYSYLQPG